MADATCPHCGGEAYAEYVDIGVGYQQVTPAVCGTCGASQMYGWLDQDANPADEDEKRTGWWKGPPWMREPFNPYAVEPEDVERIKASMAASLPARPAPKRRRQSDV